MKKSTLTSVCLAAMLFVAGNLNAQDASKSKSSSSTSESTSPKTIEEKADQRTKHLTKELDLNADQQKQVHEVVLTSLKQEQADKVTANGDPAKEKELEKARMKTKKESFQKILTPAQYSKLEAKWKSEKEKSESVKK